MQSETNFTDVLDRYIYDYNKIGIFECENFYTPLKISVTNVITKGVSQDFLIMFSIFLADFTRRLGCLRK